MIAVNLFWHATSVHLHQTIHADHVTKLDSDSSGNNFWRQLLPVNIPARRCMPGVLQPHWLSLMFVMDCNHQHEQGTGSAIVRLWSWSLEHRRSGIPRASSALRRSRPAEPVKGHALVPSGCWCSAAMSISLAGTSPSACRLFCLCSLPTCMISHMA